MKRRIIIGVAIFLAATVGLVVVSGAAIYGWARTDGGREWIASQVAALASVSGERKVTIGGLDGDPFGSFRLTDVTVRDSAGTWLTIGSAAVDWRPWALLRGKVQLDTIRAGDVVLARKPVTDGAQPGLPDLPEAARQLARIRIDDLAIENVRLEPPVAGARVRLRAQGSVGIPREDRIRTSLNLERTDGVAGRAAVVVAYPLSVSGFDVDLQVDEPADGLIARSLDIPGLPALHARIAGSGPLTEWSGDARLAFDSFVEVTAKFTVGHGETETFELAGDAAWDPRDVPAELSDLHALSGDKVAWQLAGNLNFGQHTVTLHDVKLSGAFGKLSGSARYDFANGAGTADVALRDHDLSRIAPITGSPLEGQVELSADLKLEKTGEALSAKIRASAQDLATGNPILDSLLTRSPRLAAGLNFAPGQLSVREMQVTSDAVTLNLKGAVQLGKPTLTAEYRVAVADGVTVPVTESVEIDCRCVAEGNLSGPADDPSTTGNLTATAVLAAGVPLQETDLAYQLQNLGTGLGGSFEGHAATRLGRITARANLRLAENQWRLSDLHAEGGNATLDGGLTIPEESGLVTGTLDAKFSDLGPWFELAGYRGGGRGDIRVTFRPNGQGQGGELTAEIAGGRVEGAGNVPPVEIGRLAVKAESRDLAALKGVSVTVAASEAEIGNARMQKISIQAEGSLSRAVVSSTVEGAWEGPLSLRTNFVIAAGARQNRVDVTGLAGRVLDEDFSLTQPVRLTWTDEEFAVDSLALKFGQARLSGRLRVDGEKIDSAISADGFPLDLTDRVWRTKLAGKISGKATLQGAHSAPKGEFSAEVADFRLPGQPEKLGLSLSMKGELGNGRLALDGRVSTTAGSPAQFTGEIPIRFAQDGWQISVPPQAPLSAALQWEGKTESLWQFVPLPEHQLSGPGALDVRLSGSVSDIKLQGWLAVQNGRYESLQFGTVLKELDARIDLKGKRAEITRFAAKDGNGGTVTATGGMAFSDAVDQAFDFRADFSNFHAVRRDEFDATTGGTLVFGGTLKTAKIEGRFETDRVEIRVLDRLPPDVVELDVVEVGDSKKNETEPHQDQAAQFDPSLKITVDMPRRVFVRGRGIDSEWKGRITIGGTLQSPRITGKMESVRGQISVVGKIFRLQEGTVQFPDEPDAVPVLDVTAVYEGGQITAQAHAQGPIKNPKITLTSTPSFPQDEIVSRILFNKGASNLSSIEAAQLAIALAQLSGKGGRVGNAVELARKTLGVDVLRLESTRGIDGEENAAVSAGKYLSDDIYVGVKQGTTTESSSVGVEVEVTPNISVESEVRQSGESETSIKFKLDY